MYTVNNANLDDNWSLVALQHNELSPMENHRGNELAADEESKIFYVYEVFIYTYGTTSVVKSCNQYINTH